MKKCPKCRIQHFDAVDQCDCGYRFSTGVVEQGPSKESPTSSGLRRGLAAAGTLFLVIIAGTFIGKMAGNQAASNMKRVDRLTSTANNPVSTSTNVVTRAFVVRQKANGYSNSDLDQKFIGNLESIMVDESLKNARAHIKASGHDPSIATRDMYSSSSSLVEIAGRRFGVFDISAQNLQMKVVLSIQSEEFVRVSCIRLDNEEIPLTWGPCAQQVEQTFNVQFPRAG